MTWQEQPTEFLLCRDTGIRHRWEPITVHRDGNGFVETLQCSRCRAEKDRYLTRTGLVRAKRKSRYPEGYVRQGQGRVSKQENAAIRLEAMKRRYEL